MDKAGTKNNKAQGYSYIFWPGLVTSIKMEHSFKHHFLPKVFRVLSQGMIRFLSSANPKKHEVSLR